MTQLTEWKPNSSSNTVNQNELKAIRESLPENAVETEVRRRYSLSTFDNVAIGDLIGLHYRPEAYYTYRHLVGKRLEMENNGIWLTYQLGGYYDSIT